MRAHLSVTPAAGDRITSLMRMIMEKRGKIKVESAASGQFKRFSHKEPKFFTHRQG